MAKKNFDKSIRKRIRNNAWVRLEVSDNARLAFMRGMFLDGDTTIEVKHLVTTLNKEYGIVSGIDEEVLDRILRQVKSEPYRTFSSKGEVVVAQAPPPIQAQDGEVAFLFLTEKLKRNPLSYDALKTAFEQPDPSSISRAGVQVRATYPGEKIATLIPHRAGKPGEDIFGRIVTPVSARLPRRVILSAGEHVREEDRTFFSEIYGYVCVLGDQITVIPPLWVAPDCSAVHLIHFPQVEPVCMPTLAWLNQLLEMRDLKQQITPEDLVQIHQFMDERVSRSGHMVLVDGVKPVAGDDAYMVLHFGSEDKGILADGRIDVAVRSASFEVKSGQGIAEIIPPTAGIPGQNLMGEVIPASPGKMCHVKITERVRVELVDEQPRFFYAKIDGNASYNGNTLDVRSVLRIAGDVDQQTGNIKTDQDVEILGSVRPGFQVNSGGNVLIAGEVGDGVGITAKGDVIVGNGIVGKRAKVVTLGHLEAKHIDESTIVARKDVRIGNYINNAQVRSGGRLVVGLEDGSGGRIVGGEVLCANGVEVDTLGSEQGNGSTVVGIAPNMEMEMQLKKMDESINFCNSNILKIFRTLNIQTLNAKMIEDILRRTPPGRKKVIAELLVKLKGLIVYRDDSVKNYKALQAEIDGAFRKADITVRQKAHADVQVKIGQRSLTVQQDQTQVAFFLSDEGVQHRNFGKL